LRLNAGVAGDTLVQPQSPRSLAKTSDFSIEIAYILEIGPGPLRWYSPDSGDVRLSAAEE
jgi:hypothetical protein